MKECLIEICKEIDSSFWKDNLVTIIGLLLALTFFVFERILNYKREVRETKHNWFLNIILSPQLDEINRFYRTSDSDLKKAIDELSSKHNEISFNEYIILERSKIDDFKINRKNFFNNFSSMIRSYDEKLANKLDQIVNELDDVYTETLDQVKNNTDHQGYSSKIYANKSKVISLLFNVIKR